VCAVFLDIFSIRLHIKQQNLGSAEFGFLTFGVIHMTNKPLKAGYMIFCNMATNAE
jgi:hypothetical protein